MSKQDRIAATRDQRKQSDAASRAPGFYVVRSRTTPLGATGVKMEPAYWTGNEWRVIGWDINVSDHEVEVVRSLMLQ